MLTFQYQFVFNTQFVSKISEGIKCVGQCSLFSGQPSDMISHSACRVLSFDVSMRISTIRVRLAFRCMCTSYTDRSRPRIGPVLHGFTLERASASLTSLPGTFLMLTSCYCMRSGIRANLGGAAKRCLR